MSESVDNFLAHHGVKGMKWGVTRQDLDGGGKQVSEKKIEKLDKKFEKTGSSQKSYFKAYNHMADRMNKTEIDRINNDPRFKGKDMTQPSKLRDAYYKEYSSTATRILNEASASMIGTNASGTKKVTFEYDVDKDNFPRAFIDDVNVKHSADRPEVKLKFDKLGHISNMVLPDLEHSEELGTFLEHHGVKGMKWGQRRREVKAQREATTAKAEAAGYSRGTRFSDQQNIGNRGVRKIENRIAAGESIRSARTKEYASSTAKGLAVAAAIFATPIAIGAASRGLSGLSNNINTRRGAAAAATLLADTRGLTSYNTVGMAFNAATGTWR